MRIEDLSDWSHSVPFGGMGMGTGGRLNNYKSAVWKKRTEQLKKRQYMIHKHIDGCDIKIHTDCEKIKHLRAKIKEMDDEIQFLLHGIESHLKINNGDDYVEYIKGTGSYYNGNGAPTPYEQWKKWNCIESDE